LWNNIQDIIFNGGVSLVGILFALLAGLLMSVQGVFNTRVMDSSGMWATNSWVQFSAFITSIIVWFFAGRENLFSVFNVENKLYLLGGVIGAFITYTVIKSISGLGPAFATMLILLAQLVTSCLIEAFGFFGTEKVCFDWTKLIGVALMIAGIIIFKK
jgi:transporter family-2 protein